MSAFHYYPDQTPLDPLLDALGQHGSYAVDTEFAKIDTFKPILGLLQIKAGEHLALVDGHHCALHQIWPYIRQAQELLFHACNEDIDIFYNAGLPVLTNIFDTQTALSFLGHGLQQGYQAALREQLAISIDKGETCSDWISRPLRPEQLRYAANDVQWLPDLASQLKQKLAALHLLPFVLEDCQTTAREKARPFQPDQAYRECAAPEHSTYQLAQIQQLCVWRHALAEQRNIPKTFILKNRLIQELVHRPPQNLIQLQQHREISRDVIRQYGKTILDLLRNVPEDHALWPSRVPKPFRFKSRSQQSAFEQCLARLASELGVPGEVLFRKKWLNGLARHPLLGLEPESLPLHLRGWRFSRVVLPLAEVLQ